MMDCLDSMAPSDDDLLGFALDGLPLSRETQHHLERCSVCQQRFTRYSHTNAYLLARLYRAQCPTAEQLDLYTMFLLSPDEVLPIGEHIQHCPLCTDEVIDIRRMLADTEPLPEDEHVFAPLATLRRIVASLVPWQLQPVLRSDTPAKGWPRHYRAETLDLSLHLSRSTNGDLLLLGLLTSVDPEERVDALEGCRVELYRTTDAPHDPGPAGSPCLSTAVDDLGNILLKAVPEGEYVMLVMVYEVEICIEGLVIENG